jgi:hypothetical protein
VNVFVNENASSGGAVLTGIEVTGNRDSLNCAGDVGVIKNEDRRFPTQLEVNALDVECR